MTAPTTGRFDALRASLLDRSLCPACGAPLSGPRCLWCGVPLDGPAAQAVLRLSVTAAEAIANREVGVRALYAERDARFSQQSRGAAPPVEAGTPRSPLRPPPSSAGRVAAPSVAARRAPRAQRAGAPTWGPPPRERRTASTPRWRVQSVLQALGAGLLSAAGIVFLVFSWGVLNLQARAAIVALGTVVVFGAAQVLARRGLKQGAEAVGAVAAVLLLLDAWALRTTGIVGSGAPGVYASVASLVCAVLLAGWGTAARLRVGTVGAAVLWFAAPLPLATLDPSARSWVWVLLSSVVMGWVRHVPQVRARSGNDHATATASLLLSGGAVLAWAVAALIALASLGTTPGDGLVLLSAAAVAAAAQAWLCATAPAPHEESMAIVWQCAFVGAASVDVVAGAAVARPATGAALALVAAGFVSGLVGAMSRDSRIDQAVGTGPARAAGAGAILGRPAVTLLPAAALLISVGAGALVPGGPFAVVLLLLLTVAAAVVDRRSGDALGVGARSVAARIAVVSSPLVALVAAHGGSWATAVGLAACAAVAVWARTWGVLRSWAARSTAAAAPLTVAAIGVAANAAGAGVRDVVAIAATGGAALLSFVVAAPDRRRDERQVALTAAACSAGIGWLLLAVVPGRWDRSILLVVVAACGLVVLALVSGADRVGEWGAVLGAGAAPLVLALAALSTAVVLHPTQAAAGVVLVAANGGAAAVMLSVVARDHRGARAGRAAAAGGWTTLAAALLAAVLQSAQVAATVLLVAAVAALVTGVRDRRPELRWGALALATAASWTLLAAGGQGTPELFTAPTAVVVAVVGARRARRGRSDGVTLLAAGLTLSLLPTAVLGGAVPLTAQLHGDRRVLTTAAAVVLVLLAAHRSARRPAGVTTVLAGLGLCLSVLGPARAAVDAAGTRGSGALPELLGTLAAVLLLTACRAVGTDAPGPVQGPVRAAEPWLVTTAAVLPSVLAAEPDPAGRLRLCVLVVVGAGLAVAGSTVPARANDPWGRHLMGVGILITSAGALVAVRNLTAAPGGVVPAALGLLLVTTLFLRPPSWSRPADLARTLSSALLLVPSLLSRSEAWRPAAWAGVAAVLLTAGWLVRAQQRRATTVRYVAALAAALATAGPWWYVVAPRLDSAGPTSGPPERWALPAAALVLAAGLLGWPRRDGIPSRLTLVTPALGLAALPTLLVSDATAAGTVRLLAVVTVGGALALVAQLRRSGASRSAVAQDARWGVGVGTAVAGAAAFVAAAAGPWSWDAPIIAFGLLLTALGLLRTTQEPAAGTWPTLGPGLLLAVVLPALVSATDGAAWRPVVVVVLAVAATVLGATLRWQAPFVVGAATLVLVTALQVGPWAGRVLVQTQGWVLLALCGTLLLALGLRYERRLAQAREAVRFVATMR
ncbi:SCO7613 C-terminal domain-containing membrane protein [Cellulomonas sp. T2.31MG-18]|uniref:SCO7613 C-terminal domain-containing membrane protein n=1 Tax=Cellulomonas sp. T2.31MG-18 TaxID=3157619 RepID=UPI003671C7A5